MTLLSLRRPLAASDASFNAGGARIASRIRRCHYAIARWIACARQRRALREIADRNDFHLLKDIGVSREEAFREADKPFWRP